MQSKAPVAVQKSGRMLLPSQVLRTIHHARVCPSWHGPRGSSCDGLRGTTGSSIGAPELQTAVLVIPALLAEDIVLRNISCVVSVRLVAANGAVGNALSVSQMRQTFSVELSVKRTTLLPAHGRGQLAFIER